MDVRQVAAWLAGAGPGSVAALTGAGLSTESGIPDFRGPGGLWTAQPAAQRRFTLQAYLQDPQVRVEAWAARREHPAWSARPNDGHRALAALERAGTLTSIATQNIDGLHQAAGSDPARVIELHGTLRAAACLTCGHRVPMSEALDRVAAGEPDPACRACGGLLKSATVAFGQQLDPALLAQARRAAAASRIYLAAGSSLRVQPAADLCRVAAEAGARLVILNDQPTPYDALAEASGGAVLRGALGQVLPALAAGVGAA